MKTFIVTGFLLAFSLNAQAQTQTVQTKATVVTSQSVPQGYSANWLKQIRLPSTVWTGTGGGAKIILGIVDTGINPNQPLLSGRVLSSSSCAAVSFYCYNGVFDDNGHGTAVAAIAAGQGLTGVPITMSGVAPGATILAEKALSSAGSGTSTDVARALTAAANGGANVINLSLTYAPTSEIVTAINMATSKGALIVWAGGNSNLELNNGVNSTGLSQAALSHILFVGSVNDANQKSSFSNTPGTGSLIAGAQSAKYSSLWIMAPGENIVAPCGPTDPRFCYWTGTSMAAPVVAGAAVLLEKTWPVLIRNGTVAQLMLKSAKDLGAAGVDSTYGNGLLDLTAAFSPIGSLSAVGPGGKTLALGAMTDQTVSSATLGSLKSLASALSSYTIFDSFSRNFTSDLSKLLSPPVNTKASLGGLTYTPVWTNQFNLSNGATLQITQAVHLGQMMGLGDRENDTSFHSLYGASFGPKVSGMLYRDQFGLVMASGYGLDSAQAFKAALMGNGTNSGASDNGSTTLMDMAQGGSYGSFGVPVTSGLRLAANWSQTPKALIPTASVSSQRKAQALTAGINAQVNDQVEISLISTQLSENNGLLGAAYSLRSPVNFGSQHSSMSHAISALITVGPKAKLSLGTSMMTTGARDISTGMIAHISRLNALSSHVELILDEVYATGDKLNLAIHQPMHLTSGTAQLAMTTVDDEGYNHTRLQTINLKDSYPQTDFSLSYVRPMSGLSQAGATLSFSDHPVTAPDHAGEVILKGVYQLRY